MANLTPGLWQYTESHRDYKVVSTDTSKAPVCVIPYERQGRGGAGALHKVPEHAKANVLVLQRAKEMAQVLVDLVECDRNGLDDFTLSQITRRADELLDITNIKPGERL